MKQQTDNKLITSFLLMIDHEIQSQGQAFTNQSGLFYRNNDKVAGIYTYTCSYKQLCNDTAITGANVMSGVYLNNTYVSVGQSGLLSINHGDGSVNFDRVWPSNIKISGNFAVKDFSVYLSDQPDYTLLMDAKYHSNPKYAQQATGVSLDAKSMPAVFLVPKEQEALPLAFGGADDNYMRVKAMIVCENAFQRVAVCNILKNFKLRNLPIYNNIPFDYLGNMTGINYNYHNLTFATTNFPFITKAKATHIPNQGAFVDTTKQFAMVDFDISAWGTHL